VTDDWEQEVLDIAHNISCYLDRHENAADTLEGVIKWWLKRQCCEESEVQVQRAIDYLCCQGRINKIILSEGKALYASTTGALAHGLAKGRKGH